MVVGRNGRRLDVVIAAIVASFVRQYLYRLALPRTAAEQYDAELLVGEMFLFWNLVHDVKGSNGHYYRSKCMTTVSEPGPIQTWFLRNDYINILSKLHYLFLLHVLVFLGLVFNKFLKYYLSKQPNHTFAQLKMRHQSFLISSTMDQIATT